MRVIRQEYLLRPGTFCKSKTWQDARHQILAAIDAVRWPPGGKDFTIFPESGKKRREGNGVPSIRKAFVEAIQAQDGWVKEAQCEFPVEYNPGNLDGVKETPYGRVVVEWETGNVASCHRSLNKMTMALSNAWIKAGILIVPTRELAQYLTDRIANFEELRAYFDFWGGYPVTNSVLLLIAVEHDATSTRVQRVPKGTDGRAAR